MYSYHTRVAPSQVYADGLMTPTSLSCLMQDCSQFWLESEPGLLEWLRRENVLMLIASRQMDIVRYPAMGEHLTTTTSIYGLRSAVGYRNTFVFDEAGVAVAKSWAVGAFASAKTGVLVPIPQRLIDTYTRDEKREMDYAPRKIKLPKPPVAPVAMPVIAATRSDIDFNKHVNNAQYVRMAWEYTPKNFSCKRLRVEYKGQATEGCLITPLVYTEDERMVVVLNSEQEKPYAIIEFS